MRWKTVFKIFRRDIGRLLRNWVALVVTIGICFLPALYAWFNIGANMDPYSNTGNLSIGVACNDTGATTEQTGSLNVGETIIENLKENDSLGWDFVSEEEAVQGVKSGKYYASLVIPETFTADMLSFLDGEVGQPEIQYYVNEKKNAIAPKVTDTGATTIQNMINETFTETVGKTVAEMLGEYSGKIIEDVNESNNRIVSNLEEVKSLLSKYDKNISAASKAVSSGRSDLKTAQKAINKAISTNDAITKVIDENDKKLKEIDSKLEEIGADDLKIVQDFHTKISTAQAKISGVNVVTGAELDRIDLAADDLDSSLKSVNKTLSLTSDSLEAVSEQLDAVINDVEGIRYTEIFALLSKVNGINAEEIGSFLKEPIELQSEVLYPVENYGSGMAPFYTMLAIWVSGLVLIAILHLEVDREGFPDMTPNEAYLGRWLLFVILGIFQSLIICLGDIYLLHIQCIHPVLFCITGVEAAIVFVSLIYALATSFRHIGKALAVILVILQIPGSAGTYPIEMTGMYFRIIHPILPFTYGINAMREAIAGLYKNYYIENLLILGIFFIIAMFIGLVLRLTMLNLNRMFDIELGKTGLMECEDIGQRYEYRKIKRIADSVHLDDEMQESLDRRREKFEAGYEARTRRGILLMIFVPLTMLILMFLIPYKMVMLTLWITTMIVIAIYLIVVVFIHTNNIEHNQVAEQDGGDSDA